MQSVCEQPKKLFSATKDLGNPFQEESKDLLALDTKIFVHPSAAEVVKTHIDKGQAAFKDFFNSVGDEASFYKPIKKNKTDFFHQQAAVSSTDKKKQLLKSAICYHSFSYPVKHENVICLNSSGMRISHVNYLRNMLPVM